MKRRTRPIDRMVEKAAERLGGLLNLFEHAGKSAFGKMFDIQRMRKAYERYLSNNTLVTWVRRFVYKRTYLQIPA